MVKRQWLRYKDKQRPRQVLLVKKIGLKRYEQIRQLSIFRQRSFKVSLVMRVSTLPMTSSSSNRHLLAGHGDWPRKLPSLQRGYALRASRKRSRRFFARRNVFKSTFFFTCRKLDFRFSVLCAFVSVCVFMCICLCVCGFLRAPVLICKCLYACVSVCAYSSTSFVSVGVCTCVYVFYVLLFVRTYCYE